MKYWKIVENFLTADECKGFIDMSEKEGFKEGLIRTRGQGEVMNKDVRDNDRVIWDNKQIAGQLFGLIKEHIPFKMAMDDEYEPIGLNERFRFYRYKDGQQFKPHIDGAYKRSDTEVSLITMLLYLNDDFEGGETTLILEGQIIKPKKGMMLLFDHKILHAGRPVITGTKYVLRTDVMYRLKRYENDPTALATLQAMLLNETPQSQEPNKTEEL